MLLLLAVLAPCRLFSQGAISLEVVARTGQAGLTAINNRVSINNAGLVAFSGSTTAGSGSFVADAGGPRAVRPINGITSAQANVQINDAGLIIARRGTFFYTQDPIYYYDPIFGPILIVAGYSESSDYVQTWNADGSGSMNLVAKGVSHTDAQTLQTYKIGPFSSVGWDVSINNLGKTALLADQGSGFTSDYVIATANGSAFNTYSAWGGASPMLADDGRLVFRSGSAANSPIMLLNYNLTPSDVIASSVQGFTALGRMPGISDDGQYVAFYGDLSNAGAVALGTTPGPGIFVSCGTGGGRVVQRVAGLTDAQGAVLFTGFDGNQRVGVNYQATGRRVILTFAATNTAGAKGIWACQYDSVHPNDIRLARVLLQSGTVDGIGPFDDFRLTDPINTQGQVAFWAKSGSQQVVVRASLVFPDIDTLDDINEPLNHTKEFTDDPKDPTEMAKVAAVDVPAVRNRLILRRGNTCDIALSLPTALASRLGVASFRATDLLTTSPVSIDIPIVQSVLPVGSWAAHLEGSSPPANGLTQLRYRIVIPTSAPVGAYQFSVLFQLDSQAGGQAEQTFPETVVILFNPWEGHGGAKDQVFWTSSEPELEEYLLKQEGWMWQMVSETRNGQTTKSRKPLAWDFAQFNSPYCIESVLFSLGSLSSDERRDAATVARYFTRRANSSSGGTAQPGVLVGNWTANFTGGADPESWASSADILRLYATTHTPVLFGQCWVFGGILTSMLRAVGIPTRPVTNFDSAHSMDSEPGRVDRYYFLDITALKLFPTEVRKDDFGNLHKGYLNAAGSFVERPDFDLSFCTRDSIWEYHVWCDAWMERSGARGWQAVDGTPQGYDGTGPAAHSAIMTKSGGDYDVNFLVEEVDAPVLKWAVSQNPSGAWERWALRSTAGQPNPDNAGVGTEIVTQQPSSLTARLPASKLPITALYKAAPASPVRSPKDISDWDISFLAPAAVPLGQPVSYLIGLTNRSSLTRVFHIDLVLVVVGYDGEVFAALPSPLSTEVIVPSERVELLLPTLDATVYLPKSSGAETIEAHLCVVEIATPEAVAIVRRTGLAEPAIALSLPCWPCHAGEAFGVSASWTNELTMPLTSGSLLVSTHGILTQPDLSAGFGQTRTNLGVEESLGCATNLAGLAEGAMLVAATVSCPEIKPIRETGIVSIGPQLRLSIKAAGQNGIALEFPALNGRRYTLEASSPNPGGPWKTVGGELLGWGTNAVVALPSQGQSNFYRVRALAQ